MDEEERAAWLRLALTPGLGSVPARALLAHFGLPTAIFSGALTLRELASVVGEELALVLHAPPAKPVAETMERTLAWLAGGPQRHVITLADAAYPAGLLALSDPPLLLTAEGRTELLSQAALAIVGSRNATRQGALNAAAFASHLGRAGLCIVSGLARGIDAAAHRGALDAGCATIALLGTGSDIIYPPSHRSLAAAIARDGLLLSELPVGTPPRPGNFPRRNRLIAALSRGVLVVEAAVQSGSLITARLAAELGREVFAIPGSIHAPLARGCHRLIRDGAKLVESARDVLEELGLAPISAPAADPAAPMSPTGLAAAHGDLLAALGHDPADIDTIARRTGRDAGSVAAGLLELEMANRVERLAGNRYQRLVSTS
jgi:DNA processing protein